MNMVGTYPIMLCTDMTRMALEVPTNQIAGLGVLFGNTNPKIQKYFYLHIEGAGCWGRL